MNENKINQSLLFSLSLLLGLSACFFIPEFKIFGVNIKSINVFSDITKEIPSPIQKPKILIKKEFIDSCPKGMTCIEDYSKKKDALNKIFDALQEIHENKSKVRIAFFGDSFIEGDILTAEVRKKLQNRFGGGGVGFVPIASEVSGFRQTIFHRHNNINAYNIINHSKSKLPFAAGGYCFYPLANNYVTYAGISKSTRLKRFNNIRVFYETSKELPITYTAHQKATIFNTKASNKIEAHRLCAAFGIKEDHSG